jgi:pimeloyl-ACP methyl ester carboxylesterase
MSTAPRNGERAAAVLQGFAENRRLAATLGPLPDPSPSEGPDPYGDPDPEWLRIDWREHLKTVDVEETTVNYVDIGSGDGVDLLFVHGLSGCWQNWLENLPHFARNHRVLAPDLPGFGASPMPPWDISIEAYGRLLHDFCGAAGVRECVVVGNSMGGFIAAEAVVTAADRYQKLVLVSSAGASHARMRREPVEAAGRMLAATAPLLLKAQQRSILRPRLREAAFRMIVDQPNAMPPELLWEFLKGAGKEGFLPALAACVGYDIHDRLEDVDLPTLIVWGVADRIIPASDAIEFGRLLRHSETVIFDRCGHVPMAERPVRFNRVLEAFLARS